MESYILVFADFLRPSIALDELAGLSKEALSQKLITSDKDLGIYYVFGHTDFLFVFNSFHFERVRQIYDSLHFCYIKSIEYVVSDNPFAFSNPLSIFLSPAPSKPNRKEVFPITTFGGNYSFVCNKPDIQDHFLFLSSLPTHPAGFPILNTKRFLCIPSQEDLSCTFTNATTPPKAELLIRITSPGYDIRTLTRYFDMCPLSSCRMFPFVDENNDFVVIFSIVLNNNFVNLWRVMANELLIQKYSFSSYLNWRA